MPPQRRLRTSSPVIISPLRAPAQLPSDLFSTPSSGRASTEPATPDSPILHTRALRRERPVHLPHAVLHYDRTENVLQPWYWPVKETGERVTPGELLEYRHTHEFLGPCCLCASLESGELSYTEASIFVALTGPTTGQYTAACASGQCRYWVSLEHLYDQTGLLVKRYPRRDEDTITVASAPSTPRSQSIATIRLRRVEKDLGPLVNLVLRTPRRSVGCPSERAPERFEEATLDVPSFAPGPMVHAGNFFDLLAKLDDIAEPGVPEAVFRRLVRKCRRCGDCMSSRVILFHKCKGPKTGTNVEIEVIDLTNED